MTVHRFPWQPRPGLPGHATQEQLQARVDFYGGLCWLCGAPYEEIDHVKPAARGGADWPCNLRPICRPCNRRRSVKRHSKPRVRKWEADDIIGAMQRWVEKYGDPPAALDWHPTRAKYEGHPEAAQRFYAENVPTTTTVQDRFGSWNAGVKAAGFEPRRAGRSRRVSMT